MSLLIKGMDMPKAGTWINIRVYYDGTCATSDWQGESPSVKAEQAVEIPTHGRLIDADELRGWIQSWLAMNKYYHPHSKSKNIPIQEVYDIIGRLPTIIGEEVKE